MHNPKILAVGFILVVAFASPSKVLIAAKAQVDMRLGTFEVK